MGRSKDNHEEDGTELQLGFEQAEIRGNSMLNWAHLSILPKAAKWASKLHSVILSLITKTISYTCFLCSIHSGNIQ